jgi:hypothetical protein
MREILTPKFVINFVALCMLAIMNSACIFPDQLPKLKELKTYSPQKLEYGKTSFAEFQKLTSKIPAENLELLAGGLTIVKTSPNPKSTYKLVRVAFKDDKLDWQEFSLSRNIHIAKFTAFYGKPDSIDTTYNKVLDYYNYNFFNISVDKKTKFTKTITFFAKPPVNKSGLISVKTVTNTANKISQVPKQVMNGKKRFYEKFPYVVPGIMTESDFTGRYPNLEVYHEDKDEISNYYVMQTELAESGYYYDRAILKFENGLLTWVNLIPKNLPLSECLKYIKTPYKKEAINTNYDLYDFSGFIMVVDKKTFYVQSIGIFKEGVKL